MDRSLLAVIAGTLIVIVFTLLAGLLLLPSAIRIWLIPLGFILACIIIGVIGRLRVLHLILMSFIIYLGLMVFLAIAGTLLVGVQFPPLFVNEIVDAWNIFQGIINDFVPFLSILSDVAATLRAITGGESILAIFFEFVVASSFIGFIGLLVTGISGHVTRTSDLHVVTAPEPAVEAPPIAEPAPPSTLAVDTQPAYVPSQSPSVPLASVPEAPPPMPAPPAIEEAPPPPPPSSKGGSPSAKAIASLKGKVTKHLKGTGTKAPTGQSRCPHCNATVIHGSRYCNACEKEF
ncbi:MAG: hypothetical protein ACFFBR_00635 [Promethearchaeota archaeon]